GWFNLNDLRRDVLAMLGFDDRFEEISAFIDAAALVCPADIATQIADELSSVADIFLGTLVVDAVLKIVGVLLAPETFGLGTVVLWLASTALSEALNTVVDTNIQLLAREIHDRCLEDFTDGEDIVIEHLVPDEEDGRVVATPTWIHDPSGFVYELFEEQRLADVTATIE